MAASAWSYARVNGTPREIERAIPDLIGADGARLRIQSARRSTAPPAGTTIARGTWHSGRDSGEAEVTLIPFYAWGSEVHVALSSPVTIVGRMRWPRGRLARLAGALVSEVVTSTTPVSRRTWVRRRSAGSYPAGAASR